MSEKYLENNDKKNVTFNNMYEWLSLRKYYKVDLVEGIDYKSDDIDEAKSSAIEEKNRCEGTKMIPWKYLFAKQMYKGKIKHFNKEM